MKTNAMNTRIVLLTLPMLTASNTVLSQPITFTKITTGELVTNIGIFSGFAWGDFNNDGFLDLFVNGYSRTNNLYQNTGKGTFMKVTAGDPSFDVDYHAEVAVGDYDNDGYPDLLISALTDAAARPSMLYRNNRDGTFSRMSGGDVTNHLGYFGSCVWVDYDNDGFLDFFVPDERGFVGVPGSGTNLLFRNNGDGTFTQVTSGPVVNDDLSSAYSVLWADYDNDGFMDLLVLNNPYQPVNGTNYLYHNERNGTFRRVLTNSIATDQWPAGSIAGDWGDYDNDGLQDLFVTGNWDSNRLYHNNGDGTFATIPGPMLPTPTGGYSISCAWGDYDNDGYLDLFVCYQEGTNGLFHNNGDGTFTQVFEGPGADGGPGLSYVRCSWADYDNDGSLDLLVQFSQDNDPAGSMCGLYHNNGNSNSWLEVKCVGTVDNRSGIGAKVRVKADTGGKTFWQLREIHQNNDAGSIPLIAHFGLGQATNAEVLRIEWPCGTVQEFQNVPTRQILTITEPPRLLHSFTNGVPHFSIKGGRFMQYDIQTSTDLLAWAPIGTLMITNFSGTAQIVDTNAHGFDTRFYRAVSH
jgi:hypothetical protein